MPKLEYYKTIDVDLDALYEGGCSYVDSGKEPTKLFKDHRYIRCMEDIIKHPEKDIKDLLYYEYKLVTYDSLLKRNYNELEAYMLTKRTRGLVKSIQKGYKHTQEWEFNRFGYPRPAVSAVVVKDKIALINGHHRVAIMYALKNRILPILVFKGII